MELKKHNMHLIFKIVNRFFVFLRGLSFFLYVKMSGGSIKSIPRIGKNVQWKYPPHRGIIIGKNLDLGNNSFIEAPVGSILKIGDNVKFTYSVVISALNKVEIGSNSLIAEFCSIRDSTHQTVKGQVIKEQKGLYGKIVIGEDVWIGRNSSIFMDVIINDGAIIGANTLCSKDKYEENCIYIGTPAKFLKNRE